MSAHTRTKLRFTVKSGTAHSDSIDALAFTADGKRLLAGAVDERVSVWDVESAALLRTHEELTIHTEWGPGSRGHRINVQLTPDEKYIIGSRAKRTVAWDLESGDMILAVNGKLGGLFCDGHRLVCDLYDRAWDDITSIVIADLRDPSIEHVIKVEREVKYYGGASYHPAMDMVSCGGGGGGGAYYSMGGPRAAYIRRVQPAGEDRALVYTSHVANEDPKVLVYNVNTLELEAAYDCHLIGADPCESGFLGRDQSDMVVRVRLGKEGMTHWPRIWGETENERHHFFPDGRVLIHRPNRLVVYDGEGGEELGMIEGAFDTCFLLPDGRGFAGACYKRIRKKLENASLWDQSHAPVIASKTAVVVYDLETKTTKKMRTHELNEDIPQYSSLHIHPLGLLGRLGDYLQLWDLDTGTRIYEEPGHPSVCAAVSVDGVIALGKMNGDIELLYPVQ